MAVGRVSLLQLQLGMKLRRAREAADDVFELKSRQVFDNSCCLMRIGTGTEGIYRMSQQFVHQCLTVTDPAFRDAACKPMAAPVDVHVFCF